MGRRAQGTPILGDILAIIMFVAQLMFDHPFMSMLVFTGTASFVQALLNGNVLNFFAFTINNLYDLFNFFLTDIQSACLQIINFCLPDFFVKLFNLVKVIAFGAMLLKDALPLYLNLWQTTSNIAQVGGK
jgi:hypothetical protein